MFWHDELRLLLLVYVDDFKMSGPKANLKEGWKRIRAGLDTDDPLPVDRCLGCHHKVCDGQVNGKQVRIMQYHVRDFMESCVTAYKDACGEPDMKLRVVDTPFIASPEGGAMHRLLSPRESQMAFCSLLRTRG